jgi:outer membrane protein
LDQTNRIGDTYKLNTPYSLAAVTVSVPIFQGVKRIANIKQQKWLLKRLDWDVKNLKNTVNTQYAQTLAAYKSNLITYQTLKENVDLAKEVYDVIQLQYKRINYYNALYQLLASKIDVQKALGQINY